MPSASSAPPFRRRVGLSIARSIASLLGVRIVADIDGVTRSAELAARETARLGIRLEKLEELLVFIEDRGFWEHRGVSLRALARAAAGIVGLKRRSGGSTITQQLVRSLFIEDMHKLYRRKVVEILFALWFERTRSKKEILELYLSSVRYERGVLGVAEAMKFFFGEIVSVPSAAQSFFLIERVSNQRSALMASKIDHTLRQAVDRNKLGSQDARELMDIYARMVLEGRLHTDRADAFHRLGSKWRT